MTSKPSLQNEVTLRRFRVAIFADFVKILFTLIKTNFQNPIKIKRIKNYALKSNFYLYLTIQGKILVCFNAGF